MLLKSSIYALFDPRFPKLVMYVGKGNSGRARQHWNLFQHNGKTVNSFLRHWFENLSSEGIEPSWKFLEENVDNWQKAEKKWISYWRKKNPNLCNVLDGGNAISREHSVLGGLVTKNLYPKLFSKMGKKGGVKGIKRFRELYPELSIKARKKGAKRAHELHPNLGRISAHTRWHVNRGLSNPRCELCF